MIATSQDGTITYAPSHMAKGTRTLLTLGTVAGPLFIVVALIQPFFRSGFDPARHPLSLLSLGDLGWIQIANFVVAGLLFVASAFGMRRALRSSRGGTWGPWLIGIFGASLIGGGVFVADPALSVWPNLTWNFIPLWIAMVLGFGWTSAIAAQLRTGLRGQ